MLNGFRGATLVFIFMALGGCQHTLSDSFSFTATDTASLAIIDYPLVEQGSPYAFNTVRFMEVDLQRNIVTGLEYTLSPQIIGTRQLRPDVSLDDGSLYPIEREASQTFLVPLEMAPGTYAITGGAASPSMRLIASFDLCEAPVFRIDAGSVAIVDAPRFLSAAGFSHFHTDPDSDRVLRRARIALNSYPGIRGNLVPAELIATIRFKGGTVGRISSEKESCLYSGEFEVSQ